MNEIYAVYLTSFVLGIFFIIDVLMKIIKRLNALYFFLMIRVSFILWEGFAQLKI